MSVLDNRIVRSGHVVEAINLNTNEALTLSASKSDRLTLALKNEWNEAVQERFETALRHFTPSNTETDSITFTWEDREPTVFPGALNVVKFPDVTLHLAEKKWLIGASSTVCRGDKLSKIWVRCSEASKVNDDTPIVLKNFQEVGEIALSVISAFYASCINVVNEQGEHELRVKHKFQIEAADYPSSKLFDSLNTIRETASLFTAHQEGDWPPFRDLFELAAERITSAKDVGINIAASENVVFPEGVRTITDYFNADGRALDWRVTMGRHGIFAIEESESEQNSEIGVTKAVGICARHVPPLDDGPRLPASWVVSGNMAPELGGYF